MVIKFFYHVIVQVYNFFHFQLFVKKFYFSF